jgi:hypothetical protein
LLISVEIVSAVCPHAALREHLNVLLGASRLAQCQNAPFAFFCLPTNFLLLYLWFYLRIISSDKP